MPLPGGSSAIWSAISSATWSTWALRVGIYQYESQLTILGGLDLPVDLLPDLPKLVPLLATRCLYRGVDMPVDLPPDLPKPLTVEIYEYESQIAILGGRSATWYATWSAWVLRVGIYQYKSQIAIFCVWGVDLPLELPELSQ